MSKLFSKQCLFDSLKNLTVTEDQIRTLGLYIKTFNDEHSNILEVYEYIYEISAIHHKLVLLYLANEILQTDKSIDKNSLELKNKLVAFIKLNFYKSKNEAKKYPPLFKKFSDLEKVWEDRNVINFNSKFNKEEFFFEIDGCNGNKEDIIKVMNKYLEKLNNK